MPGSTEMLTYAARLATFQQAHQLSKRRASSQSSKKKSEKAVEWPHESPTVEEVHDHTRPANFNLLTKCSLPAPASSTVPSPTPSIMCNASRVPSSSMAGSPRTTRCANIWLTRRAVLGLYRYRSCDPNLTTVPPSWSLRHAIR